MGTSLVIVYQSQYYRLDLIFQLKYISLLGSNLMQSHKWATQEYKDNRLDLYLTLHVRKMQAQINSGHLLGFYVNCN